MPEKLPIKSQKVRWSLKETLPTGQKELEENIYHWKNQSWCATRPSHG